MAEVLLPPNATELERVLEQSTARLAQAPAPLRELWRPEACPAGLLPWLAWGLSVDEWDPDWPEEVKRGAIAESVELHRRKGTVWAVKAVLDRIGALYDLTELTGVDHHRMAIDIHNSNRLLTTKLKGIRAQIDTAKRASVHYVLTLQSGLEGSILVAGGMGAASVCTAPLSLTVRTRDPQTPVRASVFGSAVPVTADGSSGVWWRGTLRLAADGNTVSLVGHTQAVQQPPLPKALFSWRPSSRRYIAEIRLSTQQGGSAHVFLGGRSKEFSDAAEADTRWALRFGPRQAVFRLNDPDRLHAYRMTGLGAGFVALVQAVLDAGDPVGGVTLAVLDGGADSLVDVAALTAVLDDPVVREHQA